MQVVSGLACTKLAPNLGQTWAKLGPNLGQNQYLSELITGTGIPSGCTGFANNTYIFFPFHFSKYLFHLIP